ncbi:MAG: glycosyltransferase family 2 protein [Bacteroidetes bacterium]|nr:glycosyltransferase family 2 protein [Bacteroidota bacterium]
MLLGKKIVVVLPAFNASKTIAQTIAEIPLDLVDEYIVVDDASTDDTFEVASLLNIKYLIRHDTNKGYGGNQKTCYNAALSLQGDIVIMLHPDYQYTPKLIPSMAYLIASGLYPVVIGSRILGKGALNGGMPLYKYFFNRVLTWIQNLIINQKLSEYHTGYRAFSREVLETVNYNANSDDFVFDNQMIVQIFYAGYEIAEITCPTKYFEDASSINLRRSVKYGFGVLTTSFAYFLQKRGFISSPIFMHKLITSGKPVTGE